MSGPERPTHPHVQAALLMLGVVLFLVLAAALEVRETIDGYRCGSVRQDGQSVAISPVAKRSKQPSISVGRAAS